MLPARCRFLLSATLVCSSTATLYGRTSPPLDCASQHFGSYGTERPALSSTARFTITCLCFRHHRGRLQLQSVNAAPLHSFSQRGALSTSSPFPRSSLIAGLGKDQLSSVRPYVYRYLNGTTQSRISPRVFVQDRHHSVLPIRQHSLCRPLNDQPEATAHIAASRAWNSLTVLVLAVLSLTTFLRELKTFLYRSSFCDN